MLDIIYIYVLNLFEDIYIFLKKLYNLIEIKNKNYIIIDILRQNLKG
ncbi:hypothetical protein CLOBAR_01878 [Intestinibacter bartlettii DSM 16795]|nr:hypothetical protein CLOBAR_01878 [Intestinibacter bartlettii DSM 16795]